jgi:hypothetical protein
MLNLRDPRNWKDWIKETPSAIADVAEYLAGAPRDLDADAYQRWRRLLPAWRILVRRRFDTRGPDGQRLLIVLENLLACVVARLGFEASDRAIFDAAQGREHSRPQAESAMEDAGQESDRAIAAEAARNGQGGPAAPRRAQ